MKFFQSKFFADNNDELQILQWTIKFSIVKSSDGISDISNCFGFIHTAINSNHFEA